MANEGSGKYGFCTLLNFTGSNGGDPQNGVLLDSQGNLYTTAYNGGYSNDGTVSELTLATYGQSVILTATINATAGPVGPTGSVSFYDGSNPTSLGSGAVSSDVATFITSSLTAGFHNIPADYSGDSNYAASSFTSGVNINQASSTTVLTASPSPVYYGETITLTAKAAISEGVGTPTGSISFLDGSTVLGSSSLISGVATFTTSSLALGSNSLTAVYGGDTNFLGSTSLAITEVIESQTSTTLTSTLTPSLYGQKITLTATVAVQAPGTGTPTGTVTFYNGSTSLGTGALVSGVATYSTSSLPVGSLSLTAVYGGTASYYTSTSAVYTQVVNQDGTNVNISTLPNPASYGAAVTLASTVTADLPGAGVPTGSVTFYDGLAPLGSVPLTTAVATFTTSSLDVGSHTITAVYSGDINFIGGTSPTPVIQVINGDTAPTVASVTINPGEGPPGTSTYLGNSRVLSIQVVFSTAVDNTPALQGAFTLIRAGFLTTNPATMPPLARFPLPRRPTEAATRWRRSPSRLIRKGVRWRMGTGR